MQSDRLLSIIFILLNRGTVTAKELAEHFEVSLRTIYRDVEKISTTMIPIAASQGKGGGYYILDDFKMDRTFFNKDEIAPMLSMFKTFKFILQNNNKLNSFIEKLEYICEREEIRELGSPVSIEGLGDSRIKDQLSIINNAMEYRQRLTFDYTNRRLETERRTVEPVQISFDRGQWSLVAYCLNRGGFRDFRLFRMSNLSVGESFERRHISQDQLVDRLKSGFMEKAIKISLKFSSTIAPQLKEHFKEACIDAQEDGSVLINDYVPYDKGLIRFILKFGTECEVLEPKFLKEEIKEYLEKMLAIYKS